MAGESYAIPPKDRAVEGVLWYIQHYQLGGGDRLPAERVLCEEIGVSRTALRAGIMRLISCGTLESRRGSGTYVCPPKPLNIFQETYNFSDAVRTAGLHPSSRLVSTETLEADETLADKLGVAVDAPLLRMQRPDDAEPPLEAMEDIPDEELVDPNSMVDSFGTDDPVRMHRMGVNRVAIKAQVLTGGRGKAGGVKLANNDMLCRFHWYQASPIPL